MFRPPSSCSSVWHRASFGGNTAAGYLRRRAAPMKGGLQTSWNEHGHARFFPIDSVIARAAGDGEATFKEWGWRLRSCVFGAPHHLCLHSPQAQRIAVFLRIRRGQGQPGPLRDSFANWTKPQIVLVSLLGATAGQGVSGTRGVLRVVFLQGTLRSRGRRPTSSLPSPSRPGRIFAFSEASDKIGAENHDGGCSSARSLFPLYKAMTHLATRPGAFSQYAYHLAATDCQVHSFPTRGRVIATATAFKLSVKRSLLRTSRDKRGKTITTVMASPSRWDETKLTARSALGYPPRRPERRQRRSSDFARFPSGHLRDNGLRTDSLFGGAFSARIRIRPCHCPTYRNGGSAAVPLTAGALVAANGNILPGSGIRSSSPHHVLARDAQCCANERSQDQTV